MKPSFFLKTIRKQKWKENEQHFAAKQLAYEVQEQKNLNYMGDENTFHTMDFYGPSGNDEILPVILQIHGGGYISCDKFLNEAQGKYFAAHGFRVMNINYSLQPEADFIGAMQDIFCALHWLEEHAAAHRVDPEQIFVYGDSAGGHYAMLAGLIQNSSAMQEYYRILPLKHGIRGIAVSCPMYEIHSLLETRSLENLLMRRMLLPGKRKTDKRYLDNVSIPAILAREEFPEIFLLTTPTDEVLYEAVKKLHELLKEKGVCHRYREYTSEERTLGHVFHATDPEFPESEKANDDILQYFREKSRELR